MLNKLIEYFKDIFTPEWRWKYYCKKHRRDDGFISNTLESCLDGYYLFAKLSKEKTFKKVTSKDYRSITITPLIHSLYDLLLFVKDCVVSLEEDKSIPNLHVNNGFNTNLYNWLKQPEGSEWGELDLLGSILLVGDYIKIIDGFKGDIPVSYFERKLFRLLECYIVLIEVMGDIQYGEER